MEHNDAEDDLELLKQQTSFMTNPNFATKFDHLPILPLPQPPSSLISMPTTATPPTTKQNKKKRAISDVYEVVSDEYMPPLFPQLEEEYAQELLESPSSLFTVTDNNNMAYRQSTFNRILSGGHVIGGGGSVGESMVDDDE